MIHEFFPVRFQPNRAGQQPVCCGAEFGWCRTRQPEKLGPMQATRDFLEPEEQEAHRKKFEDELKRETKRETIKADFDPDRAFQEQMEKQERRAHEARHRAKFSATKR